jgi:hypothetical protein
MDADRFWYFDWKYMSVQHCELELQGKDNVSSDGEQFP